MKTNKCEQVRETGENKNQNVVENILFRFVGTTTDTLKRQWLRRDLRFTIIFVFRCRWAFGVVLWELVTLGTLIKFMMFS